MNESFDFFFANLKECNLISKSDFLLAASCLGSRSSFFFLFVKCPFFLCYIWSNRRTVLDPIIPDLQLYINEMIWLELLMTSLCPLVWVLWWWNRRSLRTRWPSSYRLRSLTGFIKEAFTHLIPMREADRRLSPSDTSSTSTPLRDTRRVLHVVRERVPAKILLFLSQGNSRLGTGLG